MFGLDIGGMLASMQRGMQNILPGSIDHLPPPTGAAQPLPPEQAHQFRPEDFGYNPNRDWSGEQRHHDEPLPSNPMDQILDRIAEKVAERIGDLLEHLPEKLGDIFNHGEEAGLNPHPIPPGRPEPNEGGFDPQIDPPFPGKPGEEVELNPQPLPPEPPEHIDPGFEGKLPAEMPELGQPEVALNPQPLPPGPPDATIFPERFVAQDFQLDVPAAHFDAAAFGAHPMIDQLPHMTQGF